MRRCAFQRQNHETWPWSCRKRIKFAAEYRSSQWRCSANYLFCRCQEGKFKHVARKLNMFEEHLFGGLFVRFNGFFQNSSFRIHHNLILPGSRSLELRKIGLKFHKFSCRTDFYVLNRLKFFNCMKNSSCRTLPPSRHTTSEQRYYSLF